MGLNPRTTELEGGEKEDPSEIRSTILDSLGSGGHLGKLDIGLPLASVRAAVAGHQLPDILETRPIETKMQEVSENSKATVG
jgi:hypothetical protein